MSRGAKRYRYATLADFIQVAFDHEIPRSEVERILDNIRMGVGLQKRDRELAKFMEQAPPSIEDDPVFVQGFGAGYEQAQNDARAGVDILAELQPPAPEAPPS
jgi:hypothetical protein